MGIHKKRPVWGHQPNVLGRKYVAATKTRCDSLSAENAKEPNAKRLTPTTRLNSDYRVLARIIAQHLRPVLADHLTDTQFCGITGNTIIGAVAKLRDNIAYAESRRIPLCVLYLDFKNVFDRIAHNYHFQTLQGYALETPLSPVSRECTKLLRPQFKQMAISTDP